MMQSLLLSQVEMDISQSWSEKRLRADTEFYVLKTETFKSTRNSKVLLGSSLPSMVFQYP